MTKYQLVKLISIAGGIDSRKRVQKIICLLQAAGMNWDVDFRLHHYGPYSSEVADLLDELASRGILIEEEQPNSVGMQYNYRVDEGTGSALEKLEKEPTTKIARQKQEFDKYHPKLEKLLKTEELWILELGSTIAHYYGLSSDWEKAEKKACEFKHVKSKKKISQAALELAKSVID